MTKWTISLGLSIMLVVSASGPTLGSEQMNVSLLLWVEDPPIPLDERKITKSDLQILAQQLKRETNWSVNTESVPSETCATKLIRRFNYWQSYIKLTVKKIMEDCATSLQQAVQPTVILMLVVGRAVQTAAVNVTSWPVTSYLLDLRRSIARRSGLTFQPLESRWVFDREGPDNWKRLKRSIEPLVDSGLWRVKREGGQKLKSRCTLSSELPGQRARQFDVFEEKDEQNKVHKLVFVGGKVGQRSMAWCFDVAVDVQAGVNLRDRSVNQPALEELRFLTFVKHLEWGEKVADFGIYIQVDQDAPKKIRSKRFGKVLRELEKKERVPHHMRFLASNPQNRASWYVADFKFFDQNIGANKAKVRLAEYVGKEPIGKRKIMTISLLGEEMLLATNLIRKYLQHLGKPKE